MSARNYLRNRMRRQKGRQGTGYDKMLLMVKPLVIPFKLKVVGGSRYVLSLGWVLRGKHDT